MEKLISDIRELFKWIKDTFEKAWENIKKALFKIYSNNKDFKKLLVIYNRTKNKRIKKKYYNKMIKYINQRLKMCKYNNDFSEG